MTLVKIKLDGDTVTQTAYANNRKAGDSVDSFTVVDVSQTQDEIDAMQEAVYDKAVKLTDQKTQDFTITDEEATKDKPAVTHTETRLVGGNLTVDDGWEPKPQTVIETVPSAQDQINAQLLKQTAQNAAANALIVKQMATLTAANTKEAE